MAMGRAIIRESPVDDPRGVEGPRSGCTAAGAGFGPRDVRSAYRFRFSPRVSGLSGLGFRLARVQSVR